MRINEESLNRVREAPFNSEHVIELLKILEANAVRFGCNAELNLDYAGPSRNIKPGDFTPYVKIGVVQN